MLNRLADRQAIADLLALFCECIDAYDIDGVVDLFTDDCRTDYGPGRGGPIRGRATLRERLLRSQGEFRHAHHQLGQIRVELAQDKASSVTYVTADHEYQDGSRETVRLQYRDELVRRPEGWRIASRKALASVVDSENQRERNWVPRHAPQLKGS